MTPAEIAALVGEIGDTVNKLDPELLALVRDGLVGLVTDDSTKVRRAIGVAIARAHRLAVEKAILDSRK